MFFVERKRENNVLDGFVFSTGLIRFFWESKEADEKIRFEANHASDEIILEQGVMFYCGNFPRGSFYFTLFHY